MAIAEAVAAGGTNVSNQNQQSLDGTTIAKDELLPRRVGSRIGNMAPTMSLLAMMAAVMVRGAAHDLQFTALPITMITDTEVPALKDVKTQNPSSTSLDVTEWTCLMSRFYSFRR